MLAPRWRHRTSSVLGATRIGGMREIHCFLGSEMVCTDFHFPWVCQIEIEFAIWRGTEASDVDSGVYSWGFHQ